MLCRIFDTDETDGKAAKISAYWNSPLVSIDKATEPLLNIVGSLTDSVQTAKQKCSKSAHGLTEDESAAVYLYTMETGKGSVYRLVNAVMRSNDTASSLPWFLYLKLLSAALIKLPPYVGNVWRGVSGDVAKNYKKDLVIYWRCFSSCSKALSVLKGFIQKDEDATIFMVECTSGKSISEYSHFSVENEILLMPDVRLIAVDETLSINGMRIVHLKEVIEASAPVKTIQTRPISALNSTHSLDTLVTISAGSQNKETTSSVMKRPSTPVLTNQTTKLPFIHSPSVTVPVNQTVKLPLLHSSTAPILVNQTQKLPLLVPAVEKPEIQTSSTDTTPIVETKTGNCKYRIHLIIITKITIVFSISMLE